MATALTRDTIIQYAARKAGNEAIDATTLQDWLNNIIDTMAQAYKFPELQKSASGSLSAYVQGQAIPEIALPADFGDLWDVHGLVVVDSNNPGGSQQALTPETWEFFDLLVAPTKAVGTPLTAGFNLNNKTWSPYPMPDRQYTWQLRYRIKPARLTSNVTIPYANDEIFIQALYVQILQFEDDDRYPAELRRLLQLVMTYLTGLNKSPIKERKVRLNSNVFLPIQEVR